MKKALLFLVIALIAAGQAHSQIDQALDYFKVRDCLSNVMSKAQADGIANPQLIYAGAFKRSITTNVPNLGNVTVNINFKLENGTSNMWLYLLSSKDGGESKFLSYVAVNVKIFGYQVIAIPLDTLLNGNLPIDVLTPLTDENWINSDKMAEIFRNSTEVSSFLGEHQPEMMSVGVFTNSNIPLFGNGISIWGLTMEAENDFVVCAIENSTQQHLCSNTPLAVEEPGNSGSMELFPNPAADDLNIRFGQKIDIGRATIFNLLGNEIMSMEFYEAESLKLDLSGVPQGIYYLFVKSPNFFVNSYFTLFK